ncbi:hypothetical protein LSH36_807g00137 [Paralvinella palmiformis]|uniref:C2CD5 C-terminal domain-containing protein n=1 Tax=Paralvinella palmiformis TaxID=53620 RepID=A0AAD9MUV4_9ANNE|nr:hypothetical protein LSH36_807g00137 [Paralvinella palmiformis]
MHMIPYESTSYQIQAIEITPLTYIPNAHIDQYLGHLNFFLIRETTSVRDEGGLNGFLHSFIAEIMAICRAHVTCLGGNSLVAYRMSECVLDKSLHKNQSQCLINVSGDITAVSYIGQQHVSDHKHIAVASASDQREPSPGCWSIRVPQNTHPSLCVSNSS